MGLFYDYYTTPCHENTRCETAEVQTTAPAAADDALEAVLGKHEAPADPPKTAEDVLADILSGDAHVADAERVGQHRNHGVDGLGVTHAGAAAQSRQQVSCLGHDFDAAAKAQFGIP